MDGRVVTKGIETATNKYNFYNGRHNFMCNMGYAKKAVNRIKLTFPKKGSYQYEDLSIYFQPVDKLHTYAKARKADQVEEITVAVSYTHLDVYKRQA